MSPMWISLLCMVTSTVCFVLLLLGYRRTRTQFLLWSALCFAGLAVNNLLLFLDLGVVSVDIDLRPLRSVTMIGSLAILVFGFIWKTER